MVASLSRTRGVTIGRTMRRTHLRTRVVAVTALYGLLLLAITFGLSWRAVFAERRWARLLEIETGTIARLEDLQRSQNSFRNQLAQELAEGQFPADAPDRYSMVRQLLARGELRTLPAMTVAVDHFEAWLQQASERNSAPSVLELQANSSEVTATAQRLIDRSKAVVAAQAPELQRSARHGMTTGLAVAWIVAIFSLAAARITVAKVVRPLEELSRAADRIAAGDLTARAPAGGDHEIYRLGEAFNNMAGALAESYEEVDKRARTDELTSLPNFRAFRERIDLEIERARRYPESFGILVIDLDRFKQFNDRFGHLAGNDALQGVARVIRDTVRTVDFPARYGGEEFAVIVPNITRESLVRIAERIRANVEAMPPVPETAPVTLSIGAAMYPRDGDGADALFAKADERLYQAKKEGRNRVVAPAA